jgi:hypothetical protein
MVWPNGSHTIPTVSSEFNLARRNPVTGVVQPHNGIDLVGWDVVVAPFAGTIIYAGYNGAAGNEVRIRRDNGDVLRLLHNRAFIRTSGRVDEGTPVAYQGTTGQSTGKHTHYETKPGGGAAVNPRGYMASQGGDPANVGGGQRTAGPNGVKRRSQPTSKSAEAGELLAPGVVGNFDGWVHGENVSGNDVWYRGVSGNWFWSGGFVEGANGTGLADLNPKAEPVTKTQRVAGGNGVRRRVGSPSTSAPEGEMLAPGTVGNFKGWVNGQSVDGNPVWFVGISGDYFWSGGFTSTSRDGLADLNPKTPTPEPTSTQRTAGPNGVRRRSLPSSQSAEAGEMLAPGTVGNFDGWTKGEAVDGNAVWFRGISGNWFWSGGFTSQSTAGLSEVAAPTTPTTPTTPDPKPTGDPDNPRGLPKVTPVYPGAAFGLEAPLGVGASRATKGTPPVPVPQVGIDRFIIHHTAATADQLDWFSYKNARSVAPTWYLRTSGQLIELIRPGLKPAATGAEWNYRSVAVETQNATGAPDWTVTDAQVEALAQAVAWLASYDGKDLDGVPVRFKIDRTHVIGHGEVLATECPGPYLRARLDAIVARALVIYGENYSTPEEPQEPGGEDDTVPVKRSWLQALLDSLKGLLGGK